MPLSSRMAAKGAALNWPLHRMYSLPARVAGIAGLIVPQILDVLNARELHFDGSWAFWSHYRSANMATPR